MAWRSSGDTNGEVRQRRRRCATDPLTSGWMQLIDNLTRHGLINSPLVAAVSSPPYTYSAMMAHQSKAMKKVDRANYVPDKRFAYMDSPQSVPLPFLSLILSYGLRNVSDCWSRQIGFGATISAPHMHAHAAENLLGSFPKADFAGGSILDVGSGSCYCESPILLTIWLELICIRC